MLAPEPAYAAQLTALRRYIAAADRIMGQLARQAGLHPTDLSALAHLLDCARHERLISPGELGRLLTLSGPATTAVIDRLERAGFVQRQHCPTDGRRIELHLNPAVSLDDGQNVMTPYGDAVRTALAGFTPEQLAVFEVILTTISSHLDAEASALEAVPASPRAPLSRGAAALPGH